MTCEMNLKKLKINELIFLDRDGLRAATARLQQEIWDEFEMSIAKCLRHQYRFRVKLVDFAIWMFNEDAQEHAFSFDNCALACGYDPEVVRDRFLESDLIDFYFDAVERGLG